jgi:energy-converting hydrogenase Eha subunit E
MTVREIITRRKRKASIVMYSGCALLVLGVILGAGGPPWRIVSIPGLVISLAAALYSLFFLRCPACAETIGYTVSPSRPFSISRKIRFCPGCGIALDSELEEKAG